MTNAPRLRCAVYTRKSTEAGLDQEFNSLDAQREACEAFIRSQSSLGWKLVADRYDDGGISGATMDRPALQRLLRDIQERRVDVVVVYKIDRLARSLADFARIVDVFDQANASFVSVTQQFNTTTSMGRLTLNVLLSFAQFEREVTAERIRDKIAASKQKGMWMGGGVPLGYRAVNRKLEIDDEEAAIVRYLFKRYLELRSVRSLMNDANSKAFHARVLRAGTRADAVDARGAGKVDTEQPPRVTENEASSPQQAPRRFGRGQLYHVLSNPIYIGKVRHRAKVYDGAHEPIVEEDTFAAAQALLAEQAPARTAPTNGTELHYASDPHARRGDAGMSRGWRLRARTVEEVVEHELLRLCEDGPRLSAILQSLSAGSEMPAALANAASMKSGIASGPHQRRRDVLRSLVRRIELGDAVLRIHVDRTQLATMLLGRRVSDIEFNDQGHQVTIESRFSLRRRGIETKLVLADPSARNASPDQGLRTLLVKANDYLRQLTDGSGRGIGEVAAAAKIDRSDFTRVLRLAFLAPDMVDRFLNGSQPVELTAQKLSRLTELPHSWAAQRTLLGA